MQPLTGSSKLYHITQDGIVIAKTDRLRAFDRHILEVTFIIYTFQQMFIGLTRLLLIVLILISFQTGYCNR